MTRNAGMPVGLPLPRDPHQREATGVIRGRRGQGADSSFNCRRWPQDAQTQAVRTSQNQEMNQHLGAFPNRKYY